MNFDVNKIRNDFPILNEKIFGKDLIYFDNAATTQKPNCVIEAISNAYCHCNANIHRGIHHLSQKATEAHEQARQTVANFINASSSDEIIFTRGTTESINLIASSLGKICKKGDEIIISAMEHHSNIVPWQMIAEQYGLTIKIIPFDKEGNLMLSEYEKLLSPSTVLVATTHISNVLGTINDVKQIIDIAHRQNVPVLIDGAQAVAHLKVDVRDIDADFYVFSGHKIYAPTGIGVLYGKREWLDRLPPYQGGGEMIDKVSFKGTSYNSLPYKFEAGTPDYISSVALATALNYLTNIGFDQAIRYEDELLQYATQQMLTIEGLMIYGTANRKSGVVSFNIEGVHHSDIGTLLDKMGVAIRTGHHCAQPLVESFGTTGMARVSFAFYNTKKEIDIFIKNTKRCLDILR